MHLHRVCSCLALLFLTGNFWASQELHLAKKVLIIGGRRSAELEVGGKTKRSVGCVYTRTCYLVFMSQRELGGVTIYMVIVSQSQRGLSDVT